MAKSEYDKLYEKFVDLTKENRKLKAINKKLKKQLYKLYSELKDEGRDIDLEEIEKCKRKYKYQKRRR